jgi:CubicO group peptidase (beta-lactamase class C family)
MTTAPPAGFCHDRFDAVRGAFAEILVNDDVGASVAVSVDGEMVVDLWGGWMDGARRRPWMADTLVNVFSSTKTLTALCALLLADRGELDLDAPVARYWPDFAANGKADVRVRHLLGHTAGLSGFEGEAGEALLYDWDAACARLAAQAPWWQPGSASGYHAITQGYLVGEVVRRISGQTLGGFLRTEIAGPLGADFHVGLDPAHFARVADLIPPEIDAGAFLMPEPGSIAARTLAGTPTDVAWTREAPWRQAEIPAANGHGNARALVRAHTPLVNGGAAFGVRLMSAAGCRRVFDEQANGIDLVLGVPVRFGLGYGIVNDTFPFSPNPNTCFWGGYGGSVIVADFDAHVCVGYAMNRMNGASIVGDTRSARLLHAVYDNLGR